MQNKEERNRLAKNELKRCERYSREKVIDKWVRLLGG